MTNKEWLATLPDERVAEMIAYRKGLPKHTLYAYSTYYALLYWLKQEHKESDDEL